MQKRAAKINEGMKNLPFKKGTKKAVTLCKERRVREGMTEAYKNKNQWIKLMQNSYSSNITALKVEDLQ